MTNEEILNLANLLLEEEDDFLVPVYKLHELILQEKATELQADELVKMLKTDERFKVYDGADNAWPPEEDEEMKALGYYRGPRVMLESRAPTKEEMMQAMREKMERSLIALKQAYQVKPDDLSDETEEELLAAMQKMKELESAFEKIEKETGEDQQ